MRNEALLDALQSYRALVAALGCTARVSWTDEQISLLGSAEQVSDPEHWNIGEHTLITRCER
jgi:hypothetical protein